MKQKYKSSDIFKSIPRKIRLMIFTAIMIMTFNSCFLKQDRTMVVYGTITDQSGQPVDSILVFFRAIQNLTGERLERVYTDKLGDYEFLMEIPKKFSAVDLAIPFWIKENPKFQSKYKGFTVTENVKATNNCCISSIGQKTRYDFQLIPK